MRFLFIVFLTVIFAFPTFAEQNKTSGLKYTTIGTPKEENANKKHLHIKRISPVPDLQKDAPPEDAEKAPIERVWEKYKSLAAGQSEKTEKTPPPAKVAPPAPPAQTSAERDAAPPIGLQGILANYYKNKAKRGQMQSRTITSPSKSSNTSADTPAAQ